MEDRQLEDLVDKKLGDLTMKDRELGDLTMEDVALAIAMESLEDIDG